MAAQFPVDPVTLSDVAQHAGVSLATASRAFNGSTRTVNAEMKERVLASAAELGYSANAQAQAVARGSTRTVAIVLGDIADPYFSSIAAGVIEEAENNDLVVTMWATGSQPERLLSTLTAMRGQRPQALILAESGQLEPHMDDRITEQLVALERTGTVVCTIGAGSGTFLRVLVDNFGSAAALARALVGIGYTDFLVLAGNPQLRTAVERTAGFISGLKSVGIEPRPDAIHEGGFSRSGALATMSAALDAGALPDCVFAVTDVMALGAIAALRSHGLEPGREIGVAGFDDIQAVRDVSPAVSTVALPLAELGAQALRTALGDRSLAPAAPIAGEVVLRESTPGR